jgi:hypothetical protein
MIKIETWEKEGATQRGILELHVIIYSLIQWCLHWCLFLSLHVIFFCMHEACYIFTVIKYRTQLLLL